MTLKKCGKEGCNPVEQMRGQMKPDDHHMQYMRYAAGKQFSEDFGVLLPLKEWWEDAYEAEDLGPENSADTRISCDKCGKATGWARRDIEEFRRHGDGDTRRHTVKRDGNLELIRQRWNDGVK